MLDLFNSEKNSSTFLEFNNVADIPIGGFSNIEKENIELKKANITIKRNTNLVSDILYFSRKNLYEHKSSRLFSFFEDTKIYVPDENVMKLKFQKLLSYKNGFFTYDLSQKITKRAYQREYIYKVTGIRLITDREKAYLIYPNGMGRIYSK